METDQELTGLHSFGRSLNTRQRRGTIKTLDLTVSYRLLHRRSHCPQGRSPNPGLAAEDSPNTSLDHRAPLPEGGHTDSSVTFRGCAGLTQTD